MNIQPGSKWLCKKWEDRPPVTVTVMQVFVTTMPFFGINTTHVWFCDGDGDLISQESFDEGGELPEYYELISTPVKSNS